MEKDVYKCQECGVEDVEQEFAVCDICVKELEDRADYAEEHSDGSEEKKQGYLLQMDGSDDFVFIEDIQPDG